MSKMFGLGAAVALTAEPSWGTPAGTLETTYLEVVSQNLSRVINKEKKPTIATGGNPTPGGYICVGEDSGGQLVFPLTFEGLGVVWQHITGLVATTTVDTPSAGVHTHDLALQLYQRPGITVGLCKGSSNASPPAFQFEIFEGYKVSTATIGWSVGSAPTLTLDGIAQTSQTRTTSTTAPTMSVLQAGSDIDSCTTATLTWNGATYYLNSLTLEINRNLQRNRKIGQNETDEPIPSDLTTVELSAAIDWESNADYNAFLLETEDDLVLTITKVIGGDTHVFTATLHNASIIEHDGSPASGNGVLTSSLKWGVRSSAGKSGLALQIINTSSTFTDV